MPVCVFGSELPDGTDLSLVESLLGELAADQSLRNELLFGALLCSCFSALFSGPGSAVIYCPVGCTCGRIVMSLVRLNDKSNVNA